MRLVISSSKFGVEMQKLQEVKVMFSTIDHMGPLNHVINNFKPRTVHIS